MLSGFRLSASVALGIIRRKGLLQFLRKLPPPRALLALLFPRRVVFAPGQDVIGSIEAHTTDGMDRDAGLIRGWALSRTERIDRVEILVDDRPAGKARIALPHPTVCGERADAEVCGFQAYLPPACVPEGRETIRVGFVVHDLSGRAYEFPAREFRLKPHSTPKPAAHQPGAFSAGTRSKARGTAKIRMACFTHDLEYGGAQLFLWELLRRLVADGGIDCVIFSPSDGPLRGDLAALGMRTELFREPSRKECGRHDQDATAICKRISEGNFDCVLANTLSGFFAVNAASEAGISSVWAVHESFTLPLWSAIYTRERPGSEFIHARLAAALGRASAVTFVAEATRRLFLGYGDDKSFLRIPYGIDVHAIENFLRAFDRDRARRALGIEPDTCVLLCMGNFEARKQQILLSQAFAEVSMRHRKALLLLVGEVPSHYSSVFRHYLRKRGIDQNIRLVPAARETYPWYGMADAFVLLSDVESMPRSLMEAMGFGLPALASNVYGVPELIADGSTGLLVEPNSLRSAIAGLERLIGLPEKERNAMSIAAREMIARNYDSQAYAAAYSSLIKSLVA